MGAGRRASGLPVDGTAGFGSRVTKFVGLGVGLGAILSGWVTLLAILGGSWTLNVRGMPIDLWIVVLTYVLGGGAGGVIVGALLPLAKWRVGAALLGILAILPVTLGVAYSMTSTAQTEFDIGAVIITATVLGIIVGIGYREIFLES